MGARLEERLGLRLRIFLFFALLALAGVALVCVALLFAYRRADAPELFGPFMIAGALSAFGLLGLTAWIWLLFDENVAKPLTRLAGEIRARAHGPAAGAIDEAEGRYLGDIGPAAAAAAKRLVEAREREEALAAARTAELQAEAARLSGALAALPTPTILTDGEGRVTLYNDAARRALSGHLCLGLGRPVFDCLDQAALAPALRAALEAGEEAECAAVPVGGGETVDVRIRPLAEGGAALALSGGTSGRTSAPAAAPLAARCAAGCGASDFGPAPASPADDAPLARLAYVVFDTETTGLDPERDEVVQIAGLRVVGGRLRPGESFETLVDPGRPIPPTATEVHGVSDEMVAGAPRMEEAARLFHDFAAGAVLVAHNAPFDMAFLHRASGEAAVAFDAPTLDTVALSAVVWGADAPHSLDALAERLDVHIAEEVRHTAMGDAEATAAAFVALLGILDEMGIKTLGEARAAARRQKRLIEEPAPAPQAAAR